MSDVTIYTKPGCPFCAAAKEDMAGKGIDYTECDVTTDVSFREAAIKLAGAAKVPVIVRGQDVQVGFGGS